MFKNYLKVAVRTLRRQVVISSINVVGLAIGLAGALLLLLFVHREQSYDTFHPHKDRVFRLTLQAVGAPPTEASATTSPPMGPALLAEYPEVEAFVRLRDHAWQHLLAAGDRRFYEEKFFYADSSFFDLFAFPLAAGDPRTALAAPNSIVLTPETARKYFGDADPMGRTMRYDDEQELTVTGVLAESPGPSHLRFDFLLSFSTFQVPRGYPVTLDDWGWTSFHSYVLLREGVDAGVLEAKLVDFLSRHFGEQWSDQVRLGLQPVEDIYFNPPVHPHIEAGNMTAILSLGAIAALLIVLVAFNYINLTVGRSLARAKEVGVRKVVGARRLQLIGQFLSESLLVMLLGVVLAAMILALSINGIEHWLGWHIGGVGEIARLLPLLLGGGLVLGLAAGVYPALLASRLGPVGVLKGGGGSAPGGLARTGFRKGLVVVQFTLAIVCIAGTLVVTRQMRFMQTRDLGFDQEHVVVLHVLGEELLTRYPALKQRLLQNPDVVSVTKSRDLFDAVPGSQPVFPEGAPEGDMPPEMFSYSMHYDFLETLGLELIAGRTHQETVDSDSSRGIILNETAARLLALRYPGWDNPLNKNLRVGDLIDGEVIGIVRDFHVTSLHDPIQPLALFIPRATSQHVMVRIADAPARVVASLERDFQSIAPDLPFEYSFLDERIRHQYENDRRFARLVTFFSALTILIACMGLFGLAMLAAARRTKEVGIRKVLGASVPSVALLVAQEFVVLVGVAAVLAGPLAFLGVQHWLDSFAYRIDLDLGIFVLAGVLAVTVALVTVSYHASRVARADPVKSLRYE